MRNNEKKQEFALRSAAWAGAYLGPMAAMTRDFATLKARGKPPTARVYLREVAGTYAEVIALQTLSGVVEGVQYGDSLTAMADKIGRAVKKVVAKEMAKAAEAAGMAQDVPATAQAAATPEDDGDEAPEDVSEADSALAVGMWLISAMCETTKSARIVDRHGDRPQVVEGGVKLSPVYELEIIDGQFLADAVEYGSAGMPTYSTRPARAWTDQKTGGAKGQEEAGMVHGAGRQMRDVTCETAPALYEAVNAAQGAAFRVNQSVAPIVTGYDAAKAYEWLLGHFLAQGMEAKKAEAKAKEMARL